MGAEQITDWNDAAASAIDWWIDAGVDASVGEEPRDWLAKLAAKADAPVAPGAALVAQPESAPLPDTLDAFLAWRTGPDAPEAGWPGQSLIAQGKLDADLLVLIDLPEREDADNGLLLSGAPGRLFDRMLAAIGRDRQSVHLATLASKRPIAGRIAPEVEEQLFALARHHVALAAPRRVLLMGNAPSRALLGMDFAQARGSLHPLNQKIGMESLTIEAVASFHPRFLIERPAMKAEAWRDLQLLVGGLDT